MGEDHPLTSNVVFTVVFTVASTAATTHLSPRRTQFRFFIRHHGERSDLAADGFAQQGKGPPQAGGQIEHAHVIRRTRRIVGTETAVEDEVTQRFGKG
jgi:hypothetical protein